MSRFQPTFLFPLLNAKCPHCHERTSFGLTELAAYWIGFLGMKFGRMVEYQIACGSCGYNQFIQKGDLPSWRALGEKYAARARGEITETELLSFAENLRLPELKELIQSSAAWECTCGESNPLNFSECWKCQSASPVQTVESKDRQVRLGGGFPWEL